MGEYDGSLRSSTPSLDRRFVEDIRKLMKPRDEIEKAVADIFGFRALSSPSQVKSDAAAEDFKEFKKPGKALTNHSDGSRVRSSTSQVKCLAAAQGFNKTLLPDV